MSRLAPRWMVAGTFAVIGAYWACLAVLSAVDLDAAAMPYVAHALAAVLAGATLAVHAPLHPLREPLVTGIVGILAFGGAVLALPHAEFNWIAGRTAAPWLAAASIALATGALAAGAAAVVRRIASTTPSAVSLLVLGALVTLGVGVMIIQVSIGTNTLGDGTFVLAVIAGVMAGGFLTQLAIDVERPVACSAGTSVFGLMLAVQRDAGAFELMVAATGALLVTGFGFLGARLASRWVIRRDLAPRVTIPVARI